MRANRCKALSSAALGTMFAFSGALYAAGPAPLPHPPGMHEGAKGSGQTTDAARSPGTGWPTPSARGIAGCGFARILQPWSRGPVVEVCYDLK
jgi:hypothetical protein